MRIIVFDYERKRYTKTKDNGKKNNVDDFIFYYTPEPLAVSETLKDCDIFRLATASSTVVRDVSKRRPSM